MEFGVGTLETRKKMVKRGAGWLVNSIHISSSKFFIYFIWKNLLFLFYTSTFIKHPHQFIYSTHLFNKTFIILLIFIIHFLTVPLSHRPTATIITIIRNQRKIRSTHTYRSTHTKNQIQHQINQHQSTHTKKNQRQSKHHHLHASTPPHIPRSTRSTQTHSHHHHQQPSAINPINPNPHTQINPQPKSTQTKQTHTNQDRPTP